MPATAIIQARMGSERLPGKVLLPLAGRPMLWHVVARARAVRGLEEVVVATSLRSEDDPIRSMCEENGIRVFSGSEEKTPQAGASPSAGMRAWAKRPE